MPALAWVLSVAPLVLSLAFETGARSGNSYVALALLPWTLLAGLPGGGRRGPADALRWTALAAAPLLLAARLDAVSGTGFGAAATALGVGLAVTGVLFLAAARARGRAAVHAAAWFAVVPGPALFERLVGPFAGSVGPDVARFSPLELLLDLACGTAAGPRSGLAALAGAAAVLVAAEVGTRMAERAR